MSFGVTAVVVGVAALGMTAYQMEQQRQMKSDADERIKQEKIRLGQEQAYELEKKKSQDINSSNYAMRLRQQTNLNKGTSATEMASQDTSTDVLGL